MLWIVMIALVLAAPMMAHAQVAGASCEVQLEEARALNVQLRKAKAQSDWSAATAEEAAISLQKKVGELETKTKTVEAPSPPTNIKGK